MDKRYCGKCGERFEPSCLDGGDQLCEECRKEYEPRIKAVADAYDKIDVKSEVEDFGTLISRKIPRARIEKCCDGCGEPISWGTYCKRCTKRRDRESERWEEQQRLAKEKLADKIRDL